MSEQRLRINSENVVHETVDGELIAIDLTGGSYYSLSGSGPAIWTLLLGGASESEICAALAVTHVGDPETIRSAVASLIEELLESELAVPGEGPGNGPAPDAPAEKAAFEMPKLERYTDMKDYFLLDPIHEVDPVGWPRPAA
ncbi:MAG TPA: PqqD family protein [Solirubrobacterales bacterium]